jgi:hypothetical protein
MMTFFDVLHTALIFLKVVLGLYAQRKIASQGLTCYQKRQEYGGEGRIGYRPQGMLIWKQTFSHQLLHETLARSTHDISRVIYEG